MKRLTKANPSENIVGVRIPLPLRERLAALAKVRGVTLSRLIRTTLLKELNHNA
jgi:predicted DNA-binding protein